MGGGSTSHCTSKVHNNYFLGVGLMMSRSVESG
jgi:hypothetical protein